SRSRSPRRSSRRSSAARPVPPRERGARGGARSRRHPLGGALADLRAEDARRRRRQRLQSFERDRLVAFLAAPVVARVAAGDRPVDALDLGGAAVVELREQPRDVLLLALFLQLGILVR